MISPPPTRVSHQSLFKTGSVGSAKVRVLAEACVYSRKRGKSKVCEMLSSQTLQPRLARKQGAPMALSWQAGED